MLKKDLLACVFNPDNLYYKNILKYPYRYGYLRLKKKDLENIVEMDIPVSQKKKIVNCILKNKEVC